MIGTQEILSITLAVLGLWVIAISIIVYRMIRHYQRLTGGKNTIGLQEVLDGMIEKERVLGSRIEHLEDAVRILQQRTVFHIQRIGIVRFNPFADTGGAQSFTMAILDGAKNGVVMTSLYGRNGNRWYVKEVTGGKGKALALSEEEQTAIKKAESGEHHE